MQYPPRRGPIAWLKRIQLPTGQQMSFWVLLFSMTVCNSMRFPTKASHVRMDVGKLKD